MINTKNLVLNCLDAVTLLGYASSEINKKRKQNVGSSLDPHLGTYVTQILQLTEGYEGGTGKCPVAK